MVSANIEVQGATPYDRGCFAIFAQHSGLIPLDMGSVSRHDEMHAKDACGSRMLADLVPDFSGRVSVLIN